MSVSLETKMLIQQQKMEQNKSTREDDTSSSRKCPTMLLELLSSVAFANISKNSGYQLLCTNLNTNTCSESKSVSQKTSHSLKEAELRKLFWHDYDLVIVDLRHLLSDGRPSHLEFVHVDAMKKLWGTFS